MTNPQVLDMVIVLMKEIFSEKEHLVIKSLHFKDQSAVAFA